MLDINAANVEISPVENGNLANPALEKQQIVEFMKYRAPVDLSSRLISMIKDVVEKSKTAKQETKVTEEKQDYYEAENELLEMLKKLYDELREFRKLNLNQNYINDQVVPDITKTLKQIIERYIPKWFLIYVIQMDYLLLSLKNLDIR